MSTYALRIIVEKIEIESDNKVVDRDTLTTIDINKPDNIIDLGLRHSEQINLMQKIQDKVLSGQSTYLAPTQTHCHDCDGKLTLNGQEECNFHAVFTDHTIKIQKKRCLHCKSYVVPSIKSLFNTSVHPDLSRLQCEMGANYSYRKAQNNMNAFSNKKRRINNHMTIKKITNQVGEVLAEKKQSLEILKEQNIMPAKTLIVQVDGGHIKTTDRDKRSIEAMSAKIYSPDSIVKITKDRSEIIYKSCVASAKEDQQKSMKKYVEVGATAQGMTEETHIMGLADGAKNCWNIIKPLEKHCKTLECILDWFHIAKKFEPMIKSFPTTLSAELQSIKQLLWNGDSKMALCRLKGMAKQDNETHQSKLNGLYIYLNSNKAYLVNYNAKAEARLPYTSQVAESTVEHLINDRHKRNQKMQWSRQGANNVLQIRASMASNTWDLDWQDALFEALEKAA